MMNLRLGKINYKTQRKIEEVDYKGLGDFLKAAYDGDKERKICGNPGYVGRGQVRKEIVFDRNERKEQTENIIKIYNRNFPKKSSCNGDYMAMILKNKCKTTLYENAMATAQDNNDNNDILMTTSQIINSYTAVPFSSLKKKRRIMMMKRNEISSFAKNMSQLDLGNVRMKKIFSMPHLNPILFNGIGKDSPLYSNYCNDKDPFKNYTKQVFNKHVLLERLRKSNDFIYPNHSITGGINTTYANANGMNSTRSSNSLQKMFMQPSDGIKKFTPKYSIMSINNMIRKNTKSNDSIV